MKCFAGCSSSTIVEVLKRKHLWPNCSPSSRTAAALSPAISPDKTQEVALRIWHEAKNGPLPYLAERGIEIPTPPTLRRHGAILHKSTNLYLPGMIAAVQAPK